MVDEIASMPAPEDAIVIAETLRLLVLAVGGISVRADGNINHRDLYDALVREHERALALCPADKPPDLIGDPNFDPKGDDELSV